MKKLFVLMLFVTSACDTNTSKGDRCGDNIIDPGEECDGYDRGGAYCQMLGYYGGRLSCNDDCTLNLSLCQEHGWCGDTVIQQYNESCEGQNMEDTRCTSIGYPSGTLSCNESCRYDLSDCEGGEACGNGILEAPEQCDGAALDNLGCADFEGFTGGTLRCATDCRFDFSGCYAAQVCGDGVLQGDERCDEENMQGLTCESIGLGGGELRCVECRFDATGCDEQALCGDGVKSGLEECDTEAFGETTCLSLGYYGGEVLCNFDCTLQTEICEMNGRCGDEQVQPSHEECDRGDLNGESCLSLGYYGGSLGCGAGCRFNTTHCKSAGYCGDGIVQATEQCEQGALGGATCASLGQYGAGLTCTAECTYDLSSCQGSCGDGVVQGAYEECDGPIGALACRDFGFVEGIITNCNPDCTVNLNSCVATATIGSSENESVDGGAMNGAGEMVILGSTWGDGVTKAPGLSEECFITTISHDNVWNTTLFGSAGDEQIQDVTVDPGTGDILVLGTTDGTMGDVGTGTTDIFLARFASDGTPGHVSQFSGTSWESDVGTAVVVDDSSNAYIVGYTDGDFDGNGMTESMDAIAMKVDPAGNLLWVRQYTGDTSGDEFFYGATLDGDGNLYAIGSTTDTFGGGQGMGDPNVLLFKISEDGTTLWVRTLGSFAPDEGVSVKCNAQGDVFIAGNTMSDIAEVGGYWDGMWDVFVAGYTSDGTLLFVNQFFDTDTEQVVGMELLPGGNMLLVGHTSMDFLGHNSAGGYDIFAVEASTVDGTPLWAALYGEMGDEYATGSFMGPGGVVYATGHTTSNLGAAINKGGEDGFIYAVYVP